MRVSSPSAQKYCTDLLARLVDVPSVFPHEEEIMQFLERELATLKLHPRRLEMAPGRSNLLCSIGSGGPRICLNAHMDTMPVNGESTPNARIDGDTLYGLGSCDDKASIAAMVTACLEIASRASEIKGSVDLLISVDEEGDGQGVKSALAQGYKCDHAIVGEPTNLNIVHAHCGLLFLKLTTAGVATHGSTPSNGINAIERMMTLVDEIKAAATHYERHPVVGPPSLNLGEMHGGDRPNRVPEKCEARIDIRIVPPLSSADVLKSVMKVIDSKDWASCEVEKMGETLETLVDSPLITAVRKSADELGVEAKLIGLRGWTEAEPFRTSLGIDSIVLGPGDLKNAHSSNEFVSISETHRAAALYADIAFRMLLNRE